MRRVLWRFPLRDDPAGRGFEREQVPGVALITGIILDATATPRAGYTLVVPSVRRFLALGGLVFAIFANPERDARTVAAATVA